MKFCGNCGAQMQDNERFCPQCGKESVVAQQAQQPQQNYQAQPNYQAQQPYQQNGNKKNVIDNLFNTPDMTASFNPTDIQQNKFMSILSYIPPLAFIPFFGCKQSPYAQYHAKQGMNLLVCQLATFLVSFLLGFIRVPKYYYYYYISVKPAWVIALQVILVLFALSFSVLGIINVANGKAKEIPIIGKYIKIFK